MVSDLAKAHHENHWEGLISSHRQIHCRLLAHSVLSHCSFVSEVKAIEERVSSTQIPCRSLLGERFLTTLCESFEACV